MEQTISLYLMKHPITHFCKNKECESSALVCETSSCSCRKQTHAKCVFTEMLPLLKVIQKKRKPIPQSMQTAVDEITAFYDKILDKISQDREMFRQWRQNYGMNEFQRELILKFEEDKSHELTGKNIVNITKNIKLSNYNVFTMDTLQKLLQKQLTDIYKIFNKLKCLYVSTQQQSEFFTLVLDKNIEGFIKEIQMGKTMAEMQTVWLSYKGLKYIPKSIGAFKKLKKLGLANNSISKIENLQKCRFLQQLWLDNNQIHSLAGLQDLPKLERCYLFGNPIDQSQQNLQLMKKLRSKGIVINLTIQKAMFFKNG